MRLTHFSTQGCVKTKGANASRDHRNTETRRRGAGEGRNRGNAEGRKREDGEGWLSGGLCKAYLRRFRLRWLPDLFCSCHSERSEESSVRFCRGCELRSSNWMSGCLRLNVASLKVTSRGGIVGGNRRGCGLVFAPQSPYRGGPKTPRDHARVFTSRRRRGSNL